MPLFLVETSNRGLLTCVFTDSLNSSTSCNAVLFNQNESIDNTNVC